MQAGRLRQRVAIMTPSTTQDSFGAFPVSAGTVFATVWAEVTALSGKELFNAQQVIAEVTHLVRIRYISGLRASMWVTLNGRYLQIEAILNPDERTRELRLLCLERNNG